MRLEAGDRVRYQIQGLPLFEGVIISFEPGGAWIESELRDGGTNCVWVNLDELREKVEQ